MNKIKLILLSIVIVTSIVLGVQSSTPRFKFLNCDWGMSPEQIIAVLHDRTTSLKENLSLKDEEKAIGLRSFKSDKNVERIVFAEISWDFIILKFLDNELAEVELWCEGLDGYKLRKEFIARFGVRSHLFRIEGMRREEWTAEDKSTLTLTMFDSVPRLDIKNIVSVSFVRPNFAMEVYNKSQEYTKSQESEWESPVTPKTDPSPIVDPSGNSSFQFLNCKWKVSPEASIEAIKETAGVVIEEIPETDIQNKVEGLRIYRIDDFEFEDYKWRLSLNFFDNRLFQVYLESNEVANIDTAKLESEFFAKYGNTYENYLDMPEMREWNAVDGSKFFLNTLPKVVVVMWQAPGYEEEYQKRKD